MQPRNAVPPLRALDGQRATGKADLSAIYQRLASFAHCSGNERKKDIVRVAVKKLEL